MCSELGCGAQPAAVPQEQLCVPPGEEEEEFQWCCALLCPSSPSPCLPWENAGIQAEGESGPGLSLGWLWMKGLHPLGLWGIWGGAAGSAAAFWESLESGMGWQAGISDPFRIPGPSTRAACSQLHPSCNFSVPKHWGRTRSCEQEQTHN